MEEFIVRIKGNLELLIWSLWIVSFLTGFTYFSTLTDHAKEEYKNYAKKLKVIAIISVAMAYAVTHIYVYLY
jgi:hypothetical protein